MHTLEKVMGAHRVEIPAHLEADAQIPVCTGLQRQGDVFVVPQKPGVDAGVPVPAEGVAVIRGENGGHTHLLAADGPVSWRALATGDGDLGVVTVDEGGIAFLLHPEHGANAMGPGSYVCRRQREQADEIRYVAD